MKQTFLVLILLPLMVSCTTANDDQSVITLNSLGYLCDAQKKAVVVTKTPGSFYLKQADNGETVFEGVLSAPVKQKDVNQTVCFADFSEYTQSGSYYVEVPGQCESTVFPIGDHVYDNPYITSMRAFYLWRCGMEVEADYAGNHYHSNACHLEDGKTDYIGIPDGHKDGTGGWHDAGDYGKYTVNAGITLGILFHAWEHFGDKLQTQPLDLPDTAPGFPEFLKELKWETDFLLKMQYPDGSGRVSHKLTRRAFADFMMPSDDHEDRFFTEWSTAATADFVGIMAMAARIFKPYDSAYAEQCLSAATLSWECLVNSPEKPFVQGDFSTGGYQTTDSDDRLWAAIQLWETTQRTDCLALGQQMISDQDKMVDSDWDWSDISNLGVFAYALSTQDGRDPQLLEKVRQAITANANEIVQTAQNDIYGRGLGGRYYWGSNGTVARQTLNLHVATLVSGNPEYENTIAAIVGHLFGNNYYNRSYVTGLGINPPMNPHDRRSATDGIRAPWPGYIVGGGHKATDWEDETTNYARNEVAINWQASLVYALAALTNSAN